MLKTTCNGLTFKRSLYDDQKCITVLNGDYAICQYHERTINDVFERGDGICVSGRDEPYLEITADAIQSIVSELIKAPNC